MRFPNPDSNAAQAEHQSDHGTRAGSPKPGRPDTVTQAVRTLPDRSCVLDNKGYVVLVSVAARAMLGFGPAYRPGIHWLDIWPSETHTLLDHALDRAQSGERVAFSVYRDEPHIAARWIGISMEPAAATPGKDYQIHITLRDVTAEKTAESQKYRFQM